MKQFQRKQQGFTLIEIAIVLVIIGLLLGGVLKGQEMIENGKAKNAINDFNGITAAFNAYRDRYRQLPGDDPGATAALRGAGWTGVTAGNGDGIVAVSNAQAFTGGGNSNAFWQELRASGLITGQVTSAGVQALPKNAFGGLVGVSNAVPGITGLSICMSQIPGKAARAVDTQLDDGLPGSGTVRATLGAVGANTAPGGAAANYDETAVFTVCRQI